MSDDYDVIILGGGAAGLSAALYTCRAMLKTLLIEKLGCGGQVLVTENIENYPGFPKGVLGPELSKLMEDQARKFGVEIIYDDVISVGDLSTSTKKVDTGKSTYTAKTIIIATGGSHKQLNVPGEEEYSGKGVSYCAVCDGNFFKGADVVVIGGGDAAIDEGLYLTKIVNSVTVIHRRDALRASKILQERAFANSKMKFMWSHVVEEFVGGELMEAVKVKDVKTGDVYEHSAAAAFIYVGFEPNSGFLKKYLKMDDSGHIYSNIRMETDIAGVYVCGDIRVDSDRQLGTAVGDGITAALSAYRYISEE